VVRDSTGRDLKGNTLWVTEPAWREGRKKGRAPEPLDRPVTTYRVTWGKLEKVKGKVKKRKVHKK